MLPLSRTIQQRATGGARGKIRLRSDAKAADAEEATDRIYRHDGPAGVEDEGEDEIAAEVE